MADSNEEAARFRELVHSLPVELFDEIFDFFMLVEEEGEVKIDRDYRPPVQLQVDWATREEFAEDYYKNTVFTGLELDKDYQGYKNIISKGLDMKEAETARVAAWLSSLSRKHRSFVRCISISGIVEIDYRWRVNRFGTPVPPWTEVSAQRCYNQVGTCKDILKKEVKGASPRSMRWLRVRVFVRRFHQNGSVEAWWRHA
ncbi:hypothetical protein CB0940_07212 [Cercospora beticola]|uniref:Uncharacterized protein n=1 Tax=Cercospora beticola TaxID=122368 RepID=A0A2G5HAG1_CERBT|nr:hypothetical protein CB0940_07212 [Cercospora beticola]PIA89530.1 hypothetical protein CB0940_07212 [Cercospora beticola]WPB03142.1 hypothetical protein RHO25_007779 [Cercospora beticola]CAK1358145.1 unnamed protein product [Cercospora beticola]